MSTIDKINLLLDEKELNQNDLLDFLGIKRRATFTEWKKGTNESYIKYIPQIAEFFNVSVSYFYDEDNNSQIFSKDELDLIKIYRSLTTNGQKEAYRRINDIADMEASNEFFVPTCKVKHSVFEVSAGVGVEIGDYEQWEEIEVVKTPDAVKADFCLTIKGDSMQPMFDDGDVILVKDQPVVDIGQICVYNIKNNGYVKKFGNNKLISLNPDYPDVEIPNQDDNIVECCGLVLGKATVLK